MLELFHNDMAVCAAKVRTMLAEKGLEWTGCHLNLREGDAQKPEYLKLNPNGVVPTLIHDGRVLIESTVICEYLDDAFPQPPLKPSDPFATAQMRLWTKQLDESVHAATGTISTCIAYRHLYLRKAPDERKRLLDGIPHAGLRERLIKAVELGMDSPTFVPAVRRFDELLDDMEEALKGGDWLTGSTFSLADLAYEPYMIRLEQLGLDELVRRRPRVLAWAERLFARPAFEEGVAKWFDPAYLKLFEEQSESAKIRVRAILRDL